MAGDVILVTKTILAPSATGAQAYSMPSELGGKTPKALLVFCGGGVNAGNVGGGDFINFCGGMTVNGGNQSYNAMTSDDAVNSTNTISEWGSDAICTTAVSGNGNMRCTVSAWSADGFTLNWTTLVVGARLMPVVVVIIAGDDAAAYTDNVSLGTGTSAIDITAPNFQPDLVLFLGCQTANASSTHGDGAAFGIGAATPTQQRCMVWGENDAVASGGQPCSQVRDDCAWMGITRTTGAAGYTVQCDTFDSQGFSLTPSASATNHRLSYMALDLDGLGVSLMDLVTETVTGNKAYTGVAFQPAFGLLAMSNMANLNTAYFNQIEAVGIVVGAFDRFGNQASHGITEDDTADPTNNKQRTDATHVLQAPNRTDVAATLANIISIESDGFTLNYSAVNGNAQRGFIILVEGPPPVPAAGARVSQLASLALSEVDADLRTSQLAALALGEVEVEVRASQLVVLVLGDLGIPTRVSQLAFLALVTSSPCLTRRCRLWKLTRLDGTVFAYTDHDRDLTVEGVTYKQCASLMSSATQTASEADAVGDTQLTGILSDDDITEADLFAGRFDGATIEIFETSWDQTTDPMTTRRLAAGITGPAKQGEGRFTVDALSYGALIAQKALLQTVTPHCRFALYDSRCGLSRAAFLETGTVTSVPALNAFTQANFRRFTDSARTESGDYFAIGKLTWTTGPNAGLSSEVKAFASGQFLLWEPLPYAISIGDEYEVAPGCDFLKPTCVGKFNNFVNFGGFPDLPGTDAIIRSPDAKQ